MKVNARQELLGSWDSEEFPGYTIELFKLYRDETPISYDVSISAKGAVKCMFGMSVDALQVGEMFNDSDLTGANRTASLVAKGVNAFITGLMTKARL